LQFVHHFCVDEGLKNLVAAFHQHGNDACSVEFFEHGFDGFFFEDQHIFVPENLRVGGEGAAASQNHPEWIPAFHGSHAQMRIVREHGACAHEYGLVFVPEAVHITLRVLARERGLCSRGAADFPV